MRDPACIALVALHLSGDEARDILAGGSIWRRFWPPQACQQPGGVVVGLSTGGRVLGEARLVRTDPAAAGGGCWWHFTEARAYTRPLPHPEALTSRRAFSAMPPVPAEVAERPAPMW